MKTLVCVPCMDMLHTEFCRSLLAMERIGDVEIMFCTSSLIYDARNVLSSAAIDGNFDRVLWLDSDMSFESDLMRRLSEHLDQGKEIVCGLYFGRKRPVRPVIYKALYLSRENGSPKANAKNYDDYPRDDIFSVAGCGFGAVMMTTAALRRVYAACSLPFFPVAGFGEDLAFCRRATELGLQIWCDSSIRLGHIGAAVFDEDLYLAGKEQVNE